MNTYDLKTRDEAIVQLIFTDNPSEIKAVGNAKTSKEKRLFRIHSRTQMIIMKECVVRSSQLVKIS